MSWREILKVSRIENKAQFSSQSIPSYIPSIYPSFLFSSNIPFLLIHFFLRIFSPSFLVFLPFSHFPPICLFLPSLLPSFLLFLYSHFSFSSITFTTRLPQFSEEEKKLIKGTADFFALNFYSTTITEHQDLSSNPDLVWDYETDQEINGTRRPHWVRGKLSTSVTHIFSAIIISDTYNIN